MYFLGSHCPFCKAGPLGIRVCVGTDESLVVMCDECDAVWLHPELKDEPYFPEETNFLCPEGDGTLASPNSYWANKEQIKAVGWWDYIVYHELDNEDKNTLNNE